MAHFLCQDVNENVGNLTLLLPTAKVGTYFLLDSDSDLFILITLNIDIIISRAVTDISMLLIKIMQEQL